MANEPVLAQENLSSPGGGDAAILSKRGSDLMEGFYDLNILRQLGLMVGLAASVAIGFAVVLWAQGGDFRPLYSNIHNIDGSKVIEVLDANEIRYKIEQKTGALLVDADQIHNARLKLADAGMPGDKTAGFELLDSEQPLGTSQFMETTRYRRGLEGELARTVKNINVVRAARVHLATPKKSSFIRDQRRASASVFVDLFPGASLKVNQVKAIANLVASSVPALALEDVTVVDQKGNLLSSKLEESEEMNFADKQLKYARKIESNLVSRINGILLSIVGEGRFKAEVSADVDFTRVEQTDEMFNPDLPAVRSEQTLEEHRQADSLAGGVPGALSNQPPAEGQAPEQVGAGGGDSADGQSSKTRVQATRNFELDRTISYTRHQVGQIRRLTIAVVVDDLASTSADGAAEEKVWTASELDRLTTLIKDAVGFNAMRGDSINVINSAFANVDVEEMSFPEPEIWEQPWVWQAARLGGSGLLLLILFFGVMRPVLKNLSSTGQEMKDSDMQRALAETGDGMSDETVTLSGGENMLLPSPNDSYEQQLNAIKGLIAEDPGRVAQVVKRWVSASE